MDNANNFRTNQPRAQRPPEAAFATARANLLVASILTAVNIVLILVNANMSFMFSMYAPQVLSAVGIYALDWGYQAEGMMYLAGAITIVVVAFLCWALSKRFHWMMVAGLVLFSADTIFMFYDIIDFTEFIFDIAFHVWVMFYLISGTVAFAKMQKAKKQHDAHCVGDHDMSAHMQPGSYQPYAQPDQNGYGENSGAEGGAYQQTSYQPPYYQGSNMGAQNSYGGNSGMTGEPYQQSGYSPYYQGSDRDGQNAEQYQNEQHDPQSDRGLDEDQRQTFSSDAFYDSGSEHDKQTDYSSHVVDINAPRDGEER